MKALVEKYIGGFLSRDGKWVFGAFLLAKICGLLISFGVVRLLEQDVYGEVSYAMSIVRFLVPFIGLGAYQGLLRYGAIQVGFIHKRSIFQYAFFNGLLLCLLLSGALALAAPLATINVPGALPYLLILSVYLVGVLFIEFARSYSRLVHLNKLFSIVEFSNVLVLLVVGLLAAWLFGAKGYVIAVVGVPIVVGATFLFKLRLKPFSRVKLLPSIDRNAFWRYSLFASIGAIAAELIYHVDILSIGNLIENPEKQVAGYRVMSLIMLSSFFVPNAFMAADFVKIAGNSSDKLWLKNYARNFVKLFIPLGLLAWLGLHLAKPLVPLIFGENYAPFTPLLTILGACLPFVYGLRIPFGNILGAVGKANWNVYIQLVTLVANILLNRYLILSHGIEGAAYATLIILAVSGLANYVFFKRYLRLLP